MTKTILTYFTDSGAPATGLSPTVRIRDLSDDSLVVTDAAMEEVGDGYYKYDYTSYDENKNYSIRCDAGASLSDGERYAYAGNESYVNDIWDADAAHHQVVGSMALQVGASGGYAVGGGQAITEAQAKELAKMVWEVILKGDKSAKEVLLSRSDFDAIKDKVTLASERSFEKEFEDIGSRLSKLSEAVGKIKIPAPVQQKATPAPVIENKVTVEVPATLTAAIRSIETAVAGIRKTVEADVAGDVKKALDEKVGALSEKLECIEGGIMMAKDGIAEIKNADEIAEIVTMLEDLTGSVLVFADRLSKIGSEKELMKKALVRLTNMKFAIGKMELQAKRRRLSARKY